jgi:hypothetical protein
MWPAAPTWLLLLASTATAPASACDSLAVLPSATADGLGGMYAKNADRHYTEAQPVAALPRLTHAAGSTITLDSGLIVPQVPTTWAHAGARPNWAHPYGGYSEGVNEFGVGIGNEHFHSHGLPTDDGAKPQAEFTDLARLVLERATTATQAIAILTDLISEYGQTCRTCPSLANYNSAFMVADTTDVFSVMAVGHEWAWRELKDGDPALNGTGVWTISNCLITGADHISPGAISTARKALGYKGTDAAFDFGVVFGTTKCDASQVRQVRSQAFLRDLAKDHKLTKADLMLTLSDHEHGGNLHQPFVAEPSFHVATIDWHASKPGHGDVSASSIVSDFSTDLSRKIVWHTGPNPCMAVYYPIIFHHEGHVSELPPFLTNGDAWYGFRYVIYNLAKENPLKIKRVQDTWRPIQLRFFEQAEKAAAEAEKMEAAAADAMLRSVLVNGARDARPPRSARASHSRYELSDDPRAMLLLVLVGPQCLRRSG